MLSNQVAAVGLWGGFGRKQNILIRRDPLFSSRGSDPSFSNTNGVPKALLPIATVPLSSIFLQRLKSAGIEEIYATTHYMHDAIRRHYMEGPGQEFNIRELWEEKIAMGTMPGVVMNILIRPELRNKTIIVFGGDIIADIDVADLLDQNASQNSRFTIALNPVSAAGVHRFGTASFTPLNGPFGTISEFREKRMPNEALRSTVNDITFFLNNSSVYVFDPEIFFGTVKLYHDAGGYMGKTSLVQRMFPNIEPQFLRELISGKTTLAPEEDASHVIARFGHPAKNFNDFGYHLFPVLAKNRLLNGYFFDGYWNDVGDPQAYWFTVWHALSRRFAMQMPFPAIAPGIWVHPTVELPDARCLEELVFIGPRVKIGRNVKIGPYTVIGEGWTIEDNAEISHSILWPQYGSENEYPSTGLFGVVRRGSVIRKSIIAGVLPLGGRTFKTLWGDDAPIPGQEREHIVLPLDIPRGSDIEIIKQTKHILIIDDSARFLKRIRETLERDNWSWITVANSVQEAAQKLEAGKYDLIILDSTLSPDHKGPTEGVELLTRYKMQTNADNFQTPVLLWSSREGILDGIDRNMIHRLTEAGVLVRSKKDSDVKFTRLSEFILKQLQKEQR